MIGRFLVFAGEVYYPSGGAYDFIGDHSTAETADEACVAHLANESGNTWGHVYDTETDEIVSRFSGDFARTAYHSAPSEALPESVRTVTDSDYGDWTTWVVREDL